MRTCIRCGAEMEEGLTLTGGYGNVLRRKGIGGKAAVPSAALCPHCGEISLYLEGKDLEKFKK